jgi:hypothetical protein
MSLNATIVEWTKSTVDYSDKCYNAVSLLYDSYTYAEVFHIS